MTTRADTGAWSVPLSDLAVDEEILAAVREAVGSGWWSTGPRVAEFEAAFADFAGARHARATPVLCDIVGEQSLKFDLNLDLDTNLNLDLNLDPADLEAAAGPRTR